MTKCSMSGCAGEYQTEAVTLTFRRQGEIVVVDHVPAEVCSVCGDQLLAPETVRALEAIVAGHGAPLRSAPVYEFDAGAGKAA